ncbi:MAG: Flagellar biosynthesis protein FlhF [candidate division BRC1 bacterium ADurb.BinA364]|nr:MAG: Flagellar biosynthesis protein FlhF [candidate division BRC1 bacterium ADurb.BinA364]
MPARKFYASTLEGALKAVKDAFGSDAVIVSTRELAADEWRPQSVGPRAVEVVASSDPLPSARKPAPDTDIAPPAAPAAAPADADMGGLRGELDRIHAALRQLMLAGHGLANPYALPPHGVRLFRHLAAQGLDRHFLLSALEGLCEQAEPENAADPGWFEVAVRIDLGRCVAAAPFTQSAGELDQALAVAGPSGSGKSLSLAKIASVFRLELGVPVRIALLCPPGEPRPDAPRLAGRLLGAPVDILARAEDVPKYIDSKTGNEKVLLDIGMPGGWMGPGGGTEYDAAFAAGKRLETHLVLPAGAKLGDMLACARWGAQRSAAALGFTKMDETSTAGEVYETLRQSRMPVSFFADGKRVPEDIRAARTRDLMDRLLSDWLECE